MYILHFPSWVPSENNPLNGNFIDKQIIAISKLFPSITFQLMKGKESKFCVDQKDLNNIIVKQYLSSNLYDKIPIIRQLRTFIIGKRAIKKIINQFGKPEAIHLHVAYPFGIIAVNIAKKFSIPLLLSEHWSKYLTNVANIEIKSFTIIQKYIIRKVFKNIVAFSAVSQFLLQNILLQFPKSKGVVIPNVVDTDKFLPVSAKKQKIKTILHISTLDNESKNILGLLEGIALLRTQRTDFVLKIIHDQTNAVAENFVKEHQITSFIHFLGKKNENELILLLQESDFLLLFSNYETFGCVVAEAFACGKPVVGTNTTALPELIDEKRGLLVPPKNVHLLAKQLNTMLDNYTLFESHELHLFAKENFSPAVVGKKFIDFYKQFLTL